MDQKTTKIEPIVIETINAYGRAACVEKGGRKGGEYTPLSLNERGIWHAFLSDWTSDCRANFMLALMQAGWQEAMYEAPYFWTLVKNGVSVEYVEGDIYVKDGI